VPYGEKFERGLVYAARLHRDQYRKGTRIPYVTHLLAVASLVGENGGTEDEVVAALLHDAPEDQGGEVILEDIRAQCGDEVARIVDGCTDTYEDPKPPWRERKERYLVHLASASDSVRLVSSADKLHNARTVLSDYRLLGEDLWTRFNGGKEGTLWYYRAVVDVLSTENESPLVEELDRVVSEIERLALDWGGSSVRRGVRNGRV
jgi:(p)ppGpp synthase/HD superfamily hydrolase